MINLSARSTLEEKMDDLDSPAGVVNQTLRELEAVNTLLGGYTVVLDALGRYKWPSHAITIMDIGCGGGDILRKIAAWTNQHNKQVNLIGVDYNPLIISYAIAHSTGYPSIHYKTMDVYDDNVMRENADIITCSLCLHHFKHADAVLLVRRMYEIARQQVIINDLHRHWLAYYSIKILTAVFSKSYMVKYDAPLSVARAFKRSDWAKILSEAGVKHYTIKWKWAWRWQVILHKSIS